jgi:hypothetical protein
MASASNFRLEDLLCPGTGKLSLAWRSLRCRIRLAGLAWLEAVVDSVPSGVGKAVGLGVSSEGWILAKPKKIPVRPS